MSGGVFCTCRPPSRAHWRVLQRYCNYSAFNGSRYTPSRWSAVHCVLCKGVWRTKAAYVAALPDFKGDH